MKLYKFEEDDSTWGFDANGAFAFSGNQIGRFRVNDTQVVIPGVGTFDILAVSPDGRILVLLHKEDGWLAVLRKR